MRNTKKSFLAVFMFMIISLFGVLVYAEDPTGDAPTTADSKSVLSLNVSVSGNTLLVSGETEEGMLAVALAVYDKSGKDLVTMQTAAVDDNNNYAAEIEVADGSYVVKVADYEGGNYLKRSVTVGNQSKKPSKGKKKSKKDVSKDEDSSSEEETVTENVESDEESTKTVYFPKTGDQGQYILILSGLGVVTSLLVTIIASRKETVRGKE